MKKRKSFTLAEVLVTLMVIGIVASMTIPSLLKSYTEKETVTKLTKAYAVLSRASTMIVSECDGSLLNCISDPNAANDDPTALTELAALYKVKLKIIKDCGTNSGCLTSDHIKGLDGINTWLQDTNSLAYKMLLSDGMSLTFDWNGLLNSPPILYQLFIDLNGKKSPNIIGRDIFVFNYNVNKNYLSPSTGTCDTSASGFGCTQKFLLEQAVNY